MKEIVFEISEPAIVALYEGNDIALGEIEPGVRVVLRAGDNDKPPRTRRPVNEPPPALSP